MLSFEYFLHQQRSTGSNRHSGENDYYGNSSSSSNGGGSTSSLHGSKQFKSMLQLQLGQSLPSSPSACLCGIHYTPAAITWIPTHSQQHDPERAAAFTNHRICCHAVVHTANSSTQYISHKASLISY
jgi:hypothetical protein